MEAGIPHFGRYKSDPLASSPVRYYLPDPIPHSFELPNYIHAEIAFAQEALAELKGFSRGDPVILAAAKLSTLQDALDSSRIEGTRATLSEVLADQTGPFSQRRDVVEVRNLQLATVQGLEMVRDTPIGIRLMRRLHESLMSNRENASKTPGEFRRSFVWIGAPGARLDTAELIPPAASELPDLLSDWENFVNNRREHPSVLRNAIAHYQFETIHPFLDGNGRVGRLLALLMLLDDGSLQEPVISLSSVIERNRERYYQALRDVRLKGDLAGWVEFWAWMVKLAAKSALGNFEKLSALHREYLEAAPNKPTSRLVPLLFSHPLLTVSKVAEELELSVSSAAALIQRGVECGWLSQVTESKAGSRQYWFAPEVWKIITTEPEPTNDSLL
jgi:Fic family protein